MDTAPGGARTISLGGGRLYFFNTVSTTPQTVLNKGTQRTKLTFHNPGTQDIFIAPTVAQNPGTLPLANPFQASDVTLTPSLAALGGCLRIYANGGSMVVTGAMAGMSWQAFAAANANNPLTIMDELTS